MLHKELKNLYSLPDILKLTGYVAHAKEKWTAYYDVVGEPEKKGSFGRPRHEWKNSKNTSLKETGWEDD